MFNARSTKQKPPGEGAGLGGVSLLLVEQPQLVEREGDQVLPGKDLREAELSLQQPAQVFQAESLQHLDQAAVVWVFQEAEPHVSLSMCRGYQGGDDQQDGAGRFVAPRLPHGKLLRRDGLPCQALFQPLHLPAHKEMLCLVFLHLGGPPRTRCESSMRRTDLKRSTTSSPVLFTSSSDIMLRMAAFWYT
ncbi:hypothetical protein EYF80_033931 [Liparis tanakae]|uniref:Uncharacterized protein n=1 Tax=Liparis tanakae TaxID=230148 RepID=A0A4Z2GSU1_9TELE|nr:hypothetical protein EYF80_033931 [Liparis tanakae]